MTDPTEGNEMPKNISVEYAQLGIEIAAVLQAMKVSPGMIRYRLGDPDELARRFESNDPPVITTTIVISDNPSPMAEAVTNVQLKRFVTWAMRYESGHLRSSIEDSREILNLLTPFQLALVATTPFAGKGHASIDQAYPDLKTARRVVLTYLHAQYSEHQERLARHFNNPRTLNDMQGEFDEHLRLQLLRLGVRYLIALTEWTTRDFMRTRGLKRKRLEEARRILRVYGLRFSDDSPDG